MASYIDGWCQDSIEIYLTNSSAANSVIAPVHSGETSQINVLTSANMLDCSSIISSCVVRKTTELERDSVGRNLL